METYVRERTSCLFLSRDIDVDLLQTTDFVRIVREHFSGFPAATTDDYSKTFNVLETIVVRVNKFHLLTQTQLKIIPLNEFVTFKTL